MKCPRCGAETDAKNNYCQQCGAVLRQRDNSSDDTLRLPDLSGVPLGGQSASGGEGGGRRRESAVQQKDSSRPLKVTLVVCVMAIAVAVAVCLALTVTRKGNGPLFEERSKNSETYQEYDGEPDYGTYEEPETPEPEPEEEPEAPFVEAEEHKPENVDGESSDGAGPVDAEELPERGSDISGAEAGAGEPDTSDDSETPPASENGDEDTGGDGDAGGVPEDGAADSGPGEEVITPEEADEIPL